MTTSEAGRKGRDGIREIDEWAVGYVERHPRAAITTLGIDDLDHVTAALADLAAALPQTLDQLRRYLPHTTGADRAAAGQRGVGVRQALGADEVAVPRSRGAGQSLHVSRRRARTCHRTRRGTRCRP